MTWRHEDDDDDNDDDYGEDGEDDFVQVQQRYHSAAHLVTGEKALLLPLAFLQ